MNVEPLIVEVKLKLALELFTVPLGPEVIVVSGAVGAPPGPVTDTLSTNRFIGCLCVSLPIWKVRTGGRVAFVAWYTRVPFSVTSTVAEPLLGLVMTCSSTCAQVFIEMLAVVE